MSTLADFHYNADSVTENLLTALDQINTSKSPHSFASNYFAAKQLYKELLRHHTDFNESRINEQSHYDTLDLLIAFRSMKVSSQHVKDLATILSIDSDLRTYCKKHVLGDGVFAELEYDLKIESKKDVIESALQLI